MDASRIRELLAIEVLRFCRDARVKAALLGGMTSADIEALRALVVDGGEAGLFAALALATVGDAAGLALLRRPHDHFVTNSCVEVGLAQCARVALADAEPPLHFINASMLGALAEAVGAWPNRPA